MLPTRQIQGSQAIAAFVERQIDFPVGPGRQQLLRNNMRCHLWPADTKGLDFDRTNRRIRSKRQLDRLFEVHLEVDVAAVAMHTRSDVTQRLLCTAPTA